jgi:hypothetical protein
MRSRTAVIACLVALVLLAMAFSPGHSRPLLDEGADAYVPPLLIEQRGRSSGDTGNGYGSGLGPAGGPCERAYPRAITRSHPTWWDRYEHCMRLEQTR